MSDGKDDENKFREPIDIGPPIEPRTVERQQESVRERVVTHLTWLVTLVILTSLIAIAVSPDRAVAIKELLLLVMPGLFGAFGTALGFYFGQKK